LLDEVRATPGVIDTATTTNMPLLGGSWTHDVQVGGTKGWSKFTWVSPGYFETMGIPLAMGRNFSESDTATSRHVAVVNRTFVRLYLGGRNPIGNTLQTVKEPNYPCTAYEVVGVIPDTKYSDLRSETPPMTFAPASQFPAPGPWTVMMIHSNLPSAAMMSMLKRKMADSHPEVITASGDFQTWIRNGLVRERLMATLSGFFGFLAVLLAMVGLNGTISYTVARRQNEIGVRMALGAQPGQVVAMVVRHAGRLLAIGVGAGSALSLVVGRGPRMTLFWIKVLRPVDALGSKRTFGRHRGTGQLCASALCELSGPDGRAAL
jgi:putative ABC transport system permease protein